MAGQILFFKKNYADISNPDAVATASEASDIAEFPLNRNNTSAWITTDSLDANNTTWEVDWVDSRPVTDILLVKHNFKSFTVKYWNGSSYQAFSPAIAPTTSTDETSHFNVTEVSTNKIQITILGTQTVNDDKRLFQFIATKRIGQLTGWPVIKSPKVSKNLKATRMLSGKMNVTENVGYFSFKASVANWKIAADLAIVEQLYASVESFIVWPCGGSETQFYSARVGYRLEDLFLMRLVNDYSPEYVSGLYKAGLKLDLQFEEVTD